MRSVRSAHVLPSRRAFLGQGLRWGGLGVLTSAVSLEALLAACTLAPSPSAGAAGGSVSVTPAPTTGAKLQLPSYLAFQGPSPANLNASLKQAINDGVSDIVQGRRPLSDLDGLVASWRANGGETIRGEYQTALAAGS